MREATRVRSNEPAIHKVGPATERSSVRAHSAARILSGSIFLLDGLLKWYLIQQGQRQVGVQGFGVGALSNNWLLVGIIGGSCDTAAGLCLTLGIFQRPAAIGAAGVMGLVWSFGGFGQPGYTDSGGDLVLGLVFVVLAFASEANGLASRWHLAARWPASSMRDRLLRAVAG
jgi:uncharacterized membrane protein YphA (DoxX/SURF4 family)